MLLQICAERALAFRSAHLEQSNQSSTANMILKLFNRERVTYFSILTISVIASFFIGYKYSKLPQSVKIEFSKNLHVDRRETVEKRNFESRDRTPGDVEYEDKEYHEHGVKSVNATYLEETLRYLTKVPHLGGTKANNDLATYIEKEWKSYGFDKVEQKPYDVLLSYPRRPANITLQDASGKVIFQAKTIEDAYFDHENNSESVYPFNAYSASGTVEGEYVYVNFGELRDYRWLLDQNISLSGKIHIIKYGKGFRGEKARLAQYYGALGVLLYGDPEDFGETNVTGYPHSWDLPASAIPRGNIVNVKGDPLTPLYPSIDGMYRRKENEIDYLPKIPVTPISYIDAYSLLSIMDGLEVPDPYWQGGLNFTYRVTSKTKRSLRMKVDTPKEVRTINNVVGTIVGATEPDRIVIIGNHRDAWVFGGGDPSSGTTCLMGIARALGQMLEIGWRPRRTIMIVSWDAEEYGLMGSVEWVQEYHAILSTRAVVYINVDIGVSGNYSLRAKSTSLLMDKLFSITKKMLDPDHHQKKELEKSSSLYENWRQKMPNPKNADEPTYQPLGSGSDFAAFYSFLGVPSIDLRYMYNENFHKTLSNYPAYHTIYDNFHYFKTFIDPDFRYHALVTKVMLLYGLGVADDLVLPFNLTRYAAKVLQDVDDFYISFQQMLEPQNISFAAMKTATYQLLQATETFHKQLKSVNKNDCHMVRRMNDQMMYFERSFVVPEGVLGNRETKHILYAPARRSLYQKNLFPGVNQLLFEIDVDGVDRWNGVREQISLIISMINSAKKTISNFNEL